VIHLYAFVQGLRGLDAGVRAHPLGSVVAVVGPEEPDPLRHGLVVEGLLDRAEAVLPVRFGERFADGEALAAAVTPRIEALERQLGHVAGCVEVGVRIVPRPRPETAEDGAGYMRTRLLEQVAADELHRELATRARDSVRTSHDAGYLVARADVGGFSRAVEQLLESNPAVDVLCTGPWAPYSFAAAT
jgi:hypothetical protein